MKTAAMPETEQIVCPCGSQALPVDVFQTPTRRYVRCPGCDLVFLNPRPLGTLVEEFYREDYDEAYGEAVTAGRGRPDAIGPRRDQSNQWGISSADEDTGPVGRVSL